MSFRRGVGDCRSLCIAVRRQAKRDAALDRLCPSKITRQSGVALRLPGGSSVTICSPSWSEAMFRPQTIWPNANCVRQSLPARYRAATRLHPARWRGRCWLPLPPPVGKTADLSLSSWLSVSGCNQPEPLSKKYGAKHIQRRRGGFCRGARRNPGRRSFLVGPGPFSFILSGFWVGDTGD